MRCNSNVFPMKRKISSERTNFSHKETFYRSKKTNRRKSKRTYLNCAKFWTRKRLNWRPLRRQSSRMRIRWSNWTRTCSKTARKLIQVNRRFWNCNQKFRSWLRVWGWKTLWGCKRKRNSRKKTMNIWRFKVLTRPIARSWKNWKRKKRKPKTTFRKSTETSRTSTSSSITSSRSTTTSNSSRSRSSKTKPKSRKSFRTSTSNRPCRGSPSWSPSRTNSAKR